ncbi:hypothetical protein HK101_008822, partial [Irineochytrium annulatum]
MKSSDEIEGLREIQALRRLNPHQHIIDLHDVIFEPKHGILSLNFELMDCNLYELISKKHTVLTEAKSKAYMHQICKGLEFIHSKGIFHRDIKPENILIKDTVLKIADFGSCRGIHSKQPYTEYIATRWYRSPECLLCDGIYNLKMDIWSAGCVLYEILTRVPLFPGSNELDQLHRIHLVMGTPSPKVLKQMLGITAREALRHAFFNDVSSVDLKASSSSLVEPVKYNTQAVVKKQEDYQQKVEQNKNYIKQQAPVKLPPPSYTNAAAPVESKVKAQVQEAASADDSDNDGPVTMISINGPSNVEVAEKPPQPTNAVPHKHQNAAGAQADDAGSYPQHSTTHHHATESSVQYQSQQQASHYKPNPQHHQTSLPPPQPPPVQQHHVSNATTGATTYVGSSKPFGGPAAAVSIAGQASVADGAPGANGDQPATISDIYSKFKRKTDERRLADDVLARARRSKKPSGGVGILAVIRRKGGMNQPSRHPYGAMGMPERSSPTGMGVVGTNGKGKLLPSLNVGNQGGVGVGGSHMQGAQGMSMQQQAPNLPSLFQNASDMEKGRKLPPFAK